uniref:Uncharacterized protein n=1 Tax=Glossina pallidipes TaxID=7398 RepID=A0A1B0A422_GLOPL
MTCIYPAETTKWGIRLYVLADSNTGYVYSALPYYGSNTSDSLIRPELPVSSRIPLDPYKKLLDNVPNDKGYHMYTDSVTFEVRKIVGGPIGWEFSQHSTSREYTYIPNTEGRPNNHLHIIRSGTKKDCVPSADDLRFKTTNKGTRKEPLYFEVV